MSKQVSALEACRCDLLTDEAELREKYAPMLAARVLRLRECYNRWIATPSMHDRQMVEYIIKAYGVGKSAAYSDVGIIKQLFPLLQEAPRSFHRTRAGEMALETYNKAKKKGDTKTMERCVATYAKIYDVGREDEKELPYDQVAVQPFCATLDVRVLGIKPIPNVFDVIARISKELSQDNSDIMDVEFEEADLEEADLFGPLKNDSNK